MLRLEVLPARYGDCLWIEYGTDPVRRVLIDGGAPGVYKRALKPRLERLEPDDRNFELLVVTHVDYDHIKGIIELARDETIGFRADDVWFNGYRHLPAPEEHETLAGKHGEELTDLLVRDRAAWNQRGFEGEAIAVPNEGGLPRVEFEGGLSLTVLGPTLQMLTELRPDWEKSCEDIDLTPDELEEARQQGQFATLSEDDRPTPDIAELLLNPYEEDRSAANGSSIALLAEYGDVRILLAGDAHPSTIIESIDRLGEDRLRVDVCKLPHHGSRGSVSAELIRRLDCDRYVFSSNGDQFNHPHPEAVARVIEYGGEEPELLFNYRTDETEDWDDDGLRAAHGYTTTYPEAAADGLVIEWEAAQPSASEPGRTSPIGSTRVEFTRFNALDTGMFRSGDRYLRTVGDRRVSEIELGVGQREFNELMRNVRYKQVDETDRVRTLERLAVLTRELLLDESPPPGTVTDLVRVLRSPNASPDERDAALAGLSSAPSDLLTALDRTGAGLHQIDLVANAAELSAVPFECAPDANGDPLFLSGEGVVITRRVRSDLAENRVWPTEPRVLFAWSRAGGGVPAAEHRTALLRGLQPWIPPDGPDQVLVEIEDATLAAIAAAVEGQQFSHVHLLAHGAAIRDDADDRFGIALNHEVDGRRVVTPEALAEVLAPLRSRAVIVTLAACDGGNETDTITPEKSIAHGLHLAGFPVVIASQLPFTIPGSTLMTDTFYRRVLGGVDVRRALHETRVKLYDERATAGHDWVSLVAYVQLPSGYPDLLEDIHLKSQLAALRNLRDRSELISGDDTDEVEEIRRQLRGRIDLLEDLLPRARNTAVLDENRGLLGSAEKRLAEFCFQHLDGEGAHEALRRSRAWYHAGFAANPGAHWCGVQYLALDAALDGTIDPADWKTTYRAAEVDRTRPGEYWALGTLAELALLGTLIGATTDHTATEYLEEMKRRVAALAEPPSHDPFMSTQVQLRRYVDWWRHEHGFLPGTAELADEAAELAALLVDPR